MLLNSKLIYVVFVCTCIATMYRKIVLLTYSLYLLNKYSNNALSRATSSYVVIFDKQSFLNHLRDADFSISRTSSGINPYHLTNEFSKERNIDTSNIKIRRPKIVFQEESKNEHYSSRLNYDITLATQGTVSLCAFLTKIKERWNGPISVVIGVLSEESRSYQKLINQISNQNVRIHNYLLSSSYPINTLRNIAIEKSTTSHVWLTDLYLWPSNDLYSDLLKLSPTYFTNSHLAIIVPTFVLKSTCSTILECEEKAIKSVPQTKRELNDCLFSHNCNSIGEREKMHDYLPPNWYTMTLRKTLLPIPCIYANTIVPYVVVKKSTTLPIFDERFMDISFSRVEWIEHLRYRGYQFKLLPHSFAINVPHPKSSFNNEFLKEYNHEYKILYNKFLEELRSKEEDHSVIKICAAF